MSGASMASRASSRKSTPTGAERSGRPCSAVQIAFAWTSAPGISSSPPTGVECTSRRVGAVAPTTTMRSRIMLAGTRPLHHVDERDGAGSCPGGPRKSIQALPSRKPSAGGGCPWSRSAVTTAMLSSLPAARGKLAIAPLVSLRRSEAAARAPMLRRLSSPPRTAVLPSAVALARGEHGAASVVDRVEEGEILARLGLLGELDVVDDLARPRGVKVAHDLGVERAREGPGLLQLAEGLGVDPTTSRPLTGSAPRTSKRALSASRSSGASAPDSRAPRAMPNAASATAPRATRRRDPLSVSGAADTGLPSGACARGGDR